jgi:hypothetical protein
MQPRGAFNLQPSSTETIRRVYAGIWGREWPHNDEYLCELIREVPMRPSGETRCQFLLERMREDHDFA